MTILLLVCNIPHFHARANTLRTVAFVESPNVVRSGVLNNMGQVAVYGSLGGSGDGVWREAGGMGLTLVARAGSPAPGTSTSFSFISQPIVLNDNGQTAFSAALVGPSSGNISIWSEGRGALALIARKGEQAPGTLPGVNFVGLSNPALNNVGQTAFSGTLKGPGVGLSNDRGVWSEGGGAGVAIVARDGDQAPGASTGVTFSTFTGAQLSDAGQVAFFSRLVGTGVTSSNDQSIWKAGGGTSLSLVARTGGSAADTSGGVVFASLSGPKQNDAGQIAFGGTLSGAGVTSSNSRGIWSDAGGAGQSLVARSGDQAPDAPGGVNFSFFAFGGPEISSAGKTTFLARLTGAGVTDSNDFGIWSERVGAGLEMVVRTGDHAPGTPTGINFSDLSFPKLSSVSQTLFGATLAGPGVTSSNNKGLWAEDATSNLTLVARTGDLMDVDAGPNSDLRTIGFLDRGAINDLGQVLFRAGFTDGSSGAFVVDLSNSDSADFDGDGQVNGADYLAWQRGESPIALSAEDLALWQSQFGTTSGLSTVTAIPEPSSLIVVALGLIVWVGCSRSGHI